MKFYLGILLALLSTPAMASETASVRHWMLQRLTTELSASHPNLNLVSSFSMPLVTDVITTRHPQSRQLVARLSGQLEQWKWQRWQCGELVDLYLVNGFLRRTGAAVDLSARDQQLPACLHTTERLLDVANALIFSCQYAQSPDQQLINSGLQRLLNAQGPDGAFVHQNGRPWYYLTSHALLALHYCDADRDAVNRSRDWIQRLLPAFRQQGYVDGVAESLIFLRWTGAPAAGERAYLDWLKSLIAADGGVCFRYYPGCAPRWHTVSLMMQLLLETE